MPSQDAQALARLSDVSGVALAGGRSSRMGHDKATLPLDGRPLIIWTVARLRELFTAVIVVGSPGLAALSPGVPIIPDVRAGLGPLGGLSTAMGAITTEWLFLVACDMPFLQPALIRHMASLALTTRDANVIAFRSPSGFEPLHAAYRRSLAPLVAETLQAARPSMRALLTRARILEVAPVDLARLDPLGRSAFNVNTPDDWTRAQAMVHNTSP